MNRTFKVFFACSLGAFLGTCVALQVHHYFWWTGMIVGFLVGYVSYEVKTVGTAMKDSWTSLHYWQPDFSWWKDVASYAYYQSITISTFVGAVTGLMVLLSQAGSTTYPHHSTAYQIVFSFVLLEGIGVLCMTLGFISWRRKSIEDGRQILENARSDAWEFNPVRFYGFTIWAFLVKNLWKAVPKVFMFCKTTLPNFCKHVGVFCYTVFRMIHSEMLLLCGTDAALGTIIGYWTGNAVVGMIVGGLFGVLNYEIVSKRILHIVPAD